MRKHELFMYSVKIMHTINKLLLAALMLTLCACAPKPVFNGVDITGADYAKDFVFKDQNQQEKTLDAFHGRVVAMFFGYTQCPDVCPTTLAQLAKIKAELGPQGEALQVLFVSVDPERDTPEVLKAYLNNFDSSFVGYSPVGDALEKVTKNFKIYYKKVPTQSTQSSSYTVDHSAGTYLFDPQGHIRLFMRYGMPADQLKADIQALMQERMQEPRG